MQQRLILSLLIGCVFWASVAEAGTPTNGVSLSIRVGDQGYVSVWDVTGPFPSSEVKALFSEAEKGEAFQRRIELIQKRHGVTTLLRDTKGVLFKTKRYHAVVLSATVSVPISGRYRMTLGTDGPVRLWVDGEPRFTADLSRRAFPDTDLVTLLLSKGQHRIHLVMKSGEKRWWRGYFRFLSEDFTPADALQFELAHLDEKSFSITALGRLALERDIDFENRRVSITPRLVFDGACPVRLPDTCYVSFKAPMASGEPVTAPLRSLGKHQVNAAALAENAVVQCDGHRFSAAIGIHSPHIEALASVMTQLNGTLDETIEKSTRESLLWRVEHLRELIEKGDRDFLYLSREIRNTKRMTTLLCNGEDPYHDRRNQLQRRGYRSGLDGRLHPYVLYVPPMWRESGDNKFGLVVMLHGLGSAPMKAMQTIFGKPLKEDETGAMRERYPEPIEAAPFFVLAPSGFGASGYRGFGEVDVLDVLDEVMARYRINPNRIYITGVSMGGIGAAAIPLHYPDRFAAAAPLSGYHSMFVYRQIRELSLSAWERFLVGFQSNVEWAANGRHLPLYVVHGLKDTPMHSRVLVREYQRRKYAVQMETPDLGHNVWDQTYEDHAIFKHFLKYKRNPHPNRVTFRTARLRYAKAFWVNIDDMIDYGQWAKVDATWRFENQISLTTSNISAITLANDDKLNIRRVHHVVVDGQSVPVSADLPQWSLKKTAAGWHVHEGSNPKLSGGLRKRPGLAGPIDDAFYESLLFVYSSKDEIEERLSKMLAYQMRTPRRGVFIRYPVKRDVDVTDEDVAHWSLVLIGTPSGNALLSRICKQLPIRIEKDSIRVADRVYRGEAPVASFIYPNPLNPDRYVLIHTATTIEGLFYAGHLPQVVPDYIVYDGPKWHRKKERVLKDRAIFEADFFDKYWHVKKRAEGRSLRSGLSRRPLKSVAGLEAQEDEERGIL